MEVKLIIKFDPLTNDCQVTGPVNQTELCYKALELAQDVLRKYQEKKQNMIFTPSAEEIKNIIRN